MDHVLLDVLFPNVHLPSSSPLALPSMTATFTRCVAGFMNDQIAIHLVLFVVA